MSEAALPRALLLDTCAVIWLANGDPLTRVAAEAIDNAARGEGVLVSPISAWEVGLLSRPRGGRKSVVQFLPDPRTWFARVMSGRGIQPTPLTPEIAIDASYLPGNFHGDPADRLIVTTARHLDIPIVTRDRGIISYAGVGHTKVIPC